MAFTSRHTTPMDRPDAIGAILSIYLVKPVRIKQKVSHQPDLHFTAPPPDKERPMQSGQSYSFFEPNLFKRKVK